MTSCQAVWLGDLPFLAKIQADTHVLKFRGCASSHAPRSQFRPSRVIFTGVALRFAGDPGSLVDCRFDAEDAVSLNFDSLVSHKCESAKYFGQTITFEQQETAKSNQSRLGFVRQVQTRSDVKIVLPTAQTLPVQHGDRADAELRLWHLDTIKGTRKNDTIDSKKNASPHRPDNKKRQKENSDQQKRE